MTLLYESTLKTSKVEHQGDIYLREADSASGLVHWFIRERTPDGADIKLLVQDPDDRDTLELLYKSARTRIHVHNNRAAA